jgi:hypothetical protein
MYSRHDQFLPLKKNPYPKFLLAQNCIKKGLRNIYFLVSQESYHDFEVNSLKYCNSTEQYVT